MDVLIAFIHWFSGLFSVLLFISLGKYIIKRIGCKTLTEELKWEKLIMKNFIVLLITVGLYVTTIILMP